MHNPDCPVAYEFVFVCAFFVPHICIKYKWLGIFDFFQQFYKSFFKPMDFSDCFDFLSFQI
jgi:hypothetical protein